MKERIIKKIKDYMYEVIEFYATNYLYLEAMNRH